MSKIILVVSGKRKTAVAKAKLSDGEGKVFYNGLIYTELGLFHKLALSEPLKIYEKELGELKYDIEIKTMGGGREGQIQAARLAIAKALLKATESEHISSYLRKINVISFWISRKV